MLHFNRRAAFEWASTPLTVPSKVGGMFSRFPIFGDFLKDFTLENESTAKQSGSPRAPCLACPWYFGF